MKRRTQTRSGGFGVLVLLMLAATAVGAQTAFAQSSGGQAVVTPVAGTEGRGGVDASAAPAAAQPTDARGGFASRARGGFPSGPVGGDGTISGSSGTLSAGWIAAGLVTAIIALAAGFFAWAAGRRRAWQQQSSLASYCAYHAADALC